MKTTAKLITDDFQPSQDLYKWCEQVGIDLSVVHQEMYAFIHWHKEKGIKRSNFNLAFRNWLKKGLDIKQEKQEKKQATSKLGSQSYQDYKPEAPKKSDKLTGREWLTRLKDKL